MSEGELLLLIHAYCVFINLSVWLTRLLSLSVSGVLLWLFAVAALVETAGMAA